MLFLNVKNLKFYKSIGYGEEILAICFSITFKQYQLRILEMNNEMKLFLKKHICI